MSPRWRGSWLASGWRARGRRVRWWARLARDFAILAATLGVATTLVAAARAALDRSLAQAKRELAERTEDERALGSLNAELRLALDAGRMGTWSWNAETSVLSWSPEVHRITNGLTGGFEGGLPEFLSFVHVDDRQAFDRNVADALASTHNPRRFEARLLLPGGEERWYELRGQAFEDESGTAGVVGTIADVDDRRRVEEERERLVNELAARNSELERFTYTVSHDLKSPLITIRGFLGYLEEDAIAGRLDRVKDDTGRIVDATVKMQRLLDELLDLSRVGRQSETATSFPGRDAVDEALGVVGGRVDASGAQVEVAPRASDALRRPSAHRPGPAEPHRQRRVVHGRATVSSYRHRVSVRPGVAGDHGEGQRHRHRAGVSERIFGLFEKLDPAVRWHGRRSGSRQTHRGAPRWRGVGGVGRRRHGVDVLLHPAATAAGDLSLQRPFRRSSSTASKEWTPAPGGDPLGREDGALGEAAPGPRAVLEQDLVASRVEADDVLSDDAARPHGRDVEARPAGSAPSSVSTARLGTGSVRGLEEPDSARAVPEGASFFIRWCFSKM